MSEFVPFRIAKKLNEKGFPQHMCDDGYITEKDDKYDIGDKEMIWFIPDYLPYIAAPIVSQVLKWLREDKKIFIAINIAWCYEDENTPFYKNPKMLPILKGYYVGIYNLDNLNDDKMSNKITYFETYEEAELEGIEFVLDNLI